MPPTNERRVPHQTFFSEWWIRAEAGCRARGALVWALLPHVSQVPQQLIVEGREADDDHTRANYRIEQYSPSHPADTSRLPVAALVQPRGELNLVFRAKRRPAIVLSQGGAEIPRGQRTGEARWQTNRTILVAPFYGADADGTRGGWHADLVSRIEKCEYPQYVLDSLPLRGSTASVLRLDHLQPVGDHQDAVEPTGFMLAPEALGLVGQWLDWFMTGTIAPESDLEIIRQGLLGSP